MPDRKRVTLSDPGIFVGVSIFQHCDHKVHRERPLEISMPSVGSAVLKHGGFQWAQKLSANLRELGLLFFKLADKIQTTLSADFSPVCSVVKRVFTPLKPEGPENFWHAHVRFEISPMLLEFEVS